MLTIFVLFVGLTLATAVIAYWSDNLGKKLGKKRVSLWGLRPRTTATFLTIASSWLIMIFTLCVMLVIFPPLRQSLLRYDEVKANENKLSLSAKDLTGKVGNLNGQLTALREQTQTLENQVADASGKLAKVQGQLTQSRAAATQARKARAQAQADATRARQSATAATARQKAAIEREKAASENLDAVTNQLGATTAQRQAAEQQLKIAQTDLDNANALVKSANARVKAAGFRVKVATDKVAQAKKDLSAAEKDLSAVERNLGTVRTDLREAQQNVKTAKTNASNAGKQAYAAGKQLVKATDEVTKAENKVKEAQTKVAQLEAQSEDLNRANQVLLQANQNIADEADILLSSNVRVPVGTTLAARNFSAGTSFIEAKQNLNLLFERAKEIVRGSSDTPALLSGAQLVLAPRRVPAPNVEPSDEQKFVLVAGEELYNGLADAISHSQNPLSVRIVAERNHLAGEEKLFARFIAVPVRPVLPANFLLASARLDGQSGEAQLFSSLSKLVESGREVATQKGVTPPLWRDAPNFYAPGSNEQLFQALRKVSALGAPTRVRIVTAEPIATDDQLRVKFEVEPISAVTTTATARLSPTRFSPLK